MGYATATTIEDKEMILQMESTNKKIQIKVKRIFQSVINIAAAETSTDFPPLKLNQQGNTWPREQKIPDNKLTYCNVKKSVVT